MTRRATSSPLILLGGLLVVYLVFPLGAFFVRLSGSHDRGFATPGLWSAVRTSAESASISTAVIALFGVPLAYILVRHRGRIGSVVGVVVALPLAVPPVMSGILLIYLVGPYTTIGRFFHGRITGSVAGIVLAQIFVASPFLIISARAAFAAVDPALDDLAATLGHGPLARFWLVAIPAASGGIRAGLLLTFLRAVGEYGANVIVAYHPYSLPVFTYVQFSGAGIPTTQAPTVLVLAVAAVGVAASQLRIPTRFRRQMPGGLAPRPPSPRPPAPVSFDLDVTVGSFRLALKHQSASHRLAILGASGSGKSLTLKSLAGLLGPGAGTVTYGGQEVSTIRPEHRQVGYVPQGVVLFPHLTVWEQLTFAADADGATSIWWLESMKIAELSSRYPADLSGGQRQRVSLVQALSRNPRVVLLDEPFSALDAPVKDELRGELRRLQMEAGLSTVLVTHDPEEAALLADEVIVVAAGRVLQAGTTAEVYHRPASPQVARLLGIQNVVRGTVAPGGGVATGGVVLAASTEGRQPGDEILWCIRPEHVAIDSLDGYPAMVQDVADVGSVTLATVKLLDGPELRIRTTDPVHAARGQSCLVALPAERITVWPREADEERVPTQPARVGSGEE